MNDATGKIAQEPTMATPPDAKPDLAEIAYEAEQQAARVRAVVKAMAAAHQDTDEELLFESIERLLDPICDWTHTLFEELHQSSQETRP